ncbi:PAAR domain-containing protein [Burkholderia sp. S171]|uniref:PAAR domain-containing protein n=1 Tax=Burkholderia sp. S171 TaxID=1641860 RepID=UPI00349EDF25
MRRNYLKVGDVATNGATIIEGIDKVKFGGVYLTYLYAKVRCPVCNTIGVVVPWGPRRPGKWIGKEPALDNDLCACQCDPRPHFISSQSGMFMSFESHELAAMGFSPTESGNMYWSSKGTPCEAEGRKRYPARFAYFDSVSK